MKKGDVITGTLVGFSYTKGTHSQYGDYHLCIGVLEDGKGTKHSVCLGDADAYNFGTMIGLKNKAVTVSATCSKGGQKPEDRRFNNVVFGL